MEVCDITALDRVTVDDTLDAFQHILSTTTDSADTVELIHLSLKEYLTRCQSSLVPVEICCSVGLKLSSTATWLRENCLQLWLLDFAILLTSVSIHLQPSLSHHLVPVFSILVLIVYHVGLRSRRPQILIKISLSVLERLASEIVTIVFGIHETKAHCAMFERCVALMDDATVGLKKDICNVQKLGPLENRGLILQGQCRRFQYPCRYWARHLERSDPKLDSLGEANAFLEKHFLHWLEAASIFGFIAEAAGEIERIQGLIRVMLSPHFLNFNSNVHRLERKLKYRNSFTMHGGLF